MNMDLFIYIFCKNVKKEFNFKGNQPVFFFPGMHIIFVKLNV